MPRCIFCNIKVSHSISSKTSSASICIDCAIGLKKFELKHTKEILYQIFPKNVLEAMVRLIKYDTTQKPEQKDIDIIQQDLKIIRENLPF